MASASAKLRSHDFSAEVWEGYRQRNKQVWFYPRFPNIEAYTGEQELKGKTLLLWHEQGIGEEILFLPFAIRLARQGVNIVYECDQRLVPLFSRSVPEITFVPYEVPWNEAVWAADYQCPLGDPATFQLRTWSDYPFTGGYLKPDQDQVEHFREKYSKYSNKLVGITWASSAQFWDRNKTVPVTNFEPLYSEVPCISLQYGNHYCPFKQDDEVNLSADIDRLAALISVCTDVVCISNATAHLAGALGVDNNVMVPQGKGRHWYWFPECKPHPFYANTEVFIQSIPMFWDNITNRIINKVLDK